MSESSQVSLFTIFIEQAGSSFTSVEMRLLTQVNLRNESGIRRTVRFVI
jgi:hypothetical protein